MKKRFLGLGIFALCVILGLAITPSGDIPIAGYKVLMLLIGTIVLWVTEAVPSPVGGFLFILFVPIMGIMGFDAACGAFFNSSVLFVIASYGIAVALLHTNLLKRVLRTLLRNAGRNQNKALYAFAFSTALLSAICSDIPALLMFNGLAVEFLSALGEKPGSKYGKALMLSITFASLLGGIATPAGSAINVMALQILETNAGVTCSFLAWTAVGVPAAAFLVFASTFICSKVHKSGPFEKDALELLEEVNSLPEKMDRKEKGVAIIIVLMLIAWISTTWLTEIKIAMVSIVGMFVLMFPGLDFLTWKEYQEGTSWDSILFMGAVMVVSSAVSSTGVAVWFVDKAMKTLNFAEMPLFVLFLLVAGFAGLAHIAVPSGPALMGVVIVPMIVISEAVGISPVLLTMTCAMLGSCAVIFPFDPVPLITYSKGYYSIKDMCLCGIPLYVVWITSIAAVMPLVANVL